MEKQYLLKFYEKINSFDDYNYLLAILRINCAPTISQLKLATMVNLTNGTKKCKNMWYKYKNIFLEKIPLDYIELRKNKNSVLILFYNRDLLDKRLKEKEVMLFLKEFGYEDCKSLDEYLDLLKYKFLKLNKCPNEVGIFLGYPLEDVKDFHCCKENCKLIGYWRCYNDENFAREEFRRYDNKKKEVIKEILYKSERAG